MAESGKHQQQQQNQQQSPVISEVNQMNTVNKSTKKKFEKLKTKFIELFFPSSSSSSSFLSSPSLAAPVSLNGSNSNAFIQQLSEGNGRRVSQTPSELSTESKSSMFVMEPMNNSALITNCYYGYKSHIEDDFESGRRKLLFNNKSKFTSHNSSPNMMTTSSSSNSSSSSSSMIIDDIDNHLLPSINKKSGALQANPNISLFPCDFNYCQESLSAYDASSLNTNFDPYENYTDNPFLKKSITDLITFNSDLNVLHANFEPFLSLIDGKKKISFIYMN